MDTIPPATPMENPPQTPLGGLDPAELLKQGAAQDTVLDSAASSFQSPAIEDLAAIFPQFEILELIGKGGMGAVYKVRQKDLDRIVALKILPPAIGQSPEFSMRFTREARALAKLNHPGIVTLHEFGQAGGLYFILMEFVDGVNLAQLMKTGRISPREALAIVPQICDSLQFAHDQGIVHRDIKPENILLDRLGRVKVADFGIAKVVASVCEDTIRSDDTSVPENQTLAGKIIGTPDYMAPEQIDHPSEVDHRADIYALGVVFYQMLTGELPGKQLQAPSKKVQIDVRLDEIVMRAMEKEPELRYQTASEFRTVVDEVQAPAPAPPELKQEPIVAHQRSVGKWVGIGCGLIVLILCIVSIISAVFYWSLSPTRHLPAPQTELEMPVLRADLTKAAQTWLAEMDSGNYEQSWQLAAQSFRNAVTQKEWVAMSEKVRKPLGAVVSRKFSGSLRMTTMSGMPDGAYFEITFDTSFAELKSATETVLFRSGQDGPWKVIAYYIRPAKEETADSTPPPRGTVSAQESSLQERLVDLEVAALIALKKFLPTHPVFKQAAIEVAEFIRENPASQDGNYGEVLILRRKSIISRQGELATEYGAQHPRILELRYELEAVEQLIRTRKNLVVRKRDDSVMGQIKFNFDCAGDSMPELVNRFRMQYSIRLCFELSELKGNEKNEPIMMKDMLEELEVKDAAGRLTAREKQRLDHLKISSGNQWSDVTRYNGEIAAVSVDDFLNQLTKDTPYQWRCSASGETWVVLPKEGSHLDFPVTLDTQNLTTEEVFEKVCSQSPTGRILLNPGQKDPPDGMIPWRDVRGSPQRFYKQPAWEVLCKISEVAEPDSLWVLYVNKLEIFWGCDSIYETGVTFKAQQWLAGLDTGDYAGSWKDAARLFRAAITEAGWSDTLAIARRPLGDMKSRKLRSAKHAKTLPGVPDGEYVVMQFDTSFAAKEKAVETVTFMKDPDGTWKAVGYFIR
jgi:serine/threonine protein kinase